MVRIWLFVVAIMGMPVCVLAQPLAFAPAISDGAVLQRDAPIAIQGTAQPGARINVRLGAHARDVMADQAGDWQADFLAMPAATGLELTATNGSSTIHAGNLSAGDVFLCSGQSNMQFSMDETALRRTERKLPIDSSIRLLTVPNASARVEQRDFATAARWTNADDGSGDFSAVCLIAGREIASSQDVTVGLIDASVGGTPIESWQSYDGLKAAGEAEQVMAILDAFRADPEAAELQYGAQLDALWIMPPPPGQPAGRPRVGYGNLFNAMIAPIGPMRFSGVIWYQGENNANRSEPRESYRRQLTALLASWRARFGVDLPFVIVQLSPYGALSDQPVEHNWAEIREAQRIVALADPLAEMVTTVDVGERLDIHPPMKKPVGVRAAAALAYLRYGGSPEALGPRPLEARLESDEVQIAMSGATGDLIAATWGRPGPFMLCESAESGRQCQFADAHIVEGGITVSVPEGLVPAIVRYCWAAAPICNVFDTAQRPLPAFELPVKIEPKARQET